MNFLKYILLFIPAIMLAQINDVEQDSTAAEYLIIEGDSVPRVVIDLDEVKLLHKLKFNSKKDRIRYLILRRKTVKVYPYAKMAADRLDSLNTRLESMTRRRDKKRYTKMIQKYIEGEFSDELKKLTRTEGQILVKLIHRQTGRTTFELVKELRSGWRAFWYNTTASMFDISLKREFDPINDKEDYLIEDILQRNFQSGRLERQKSALDFDFYDLTDKWLYSKTEN
ncbi:DUF4294 domain-containing protein [Hyunsoonleella aestuarii]|uniref:DUF4294 domain-containing protein n=1 Tax=Hyunsoonleella aestuarii TaxID=912802 RepID=A0ABP8EE47_9FLAO|nr:DUF4294 domain-containing protein [Hyunsoonleella aestuarii]